MQHHRSDEFKAYASFYWLIIIFQEAHLLVKLFVSILNLISRFKYNLAKIEADQSCQWSCRLWK
jgi:hypothetical protein